MKHFYGILKFSISAALCFTVSYFYKFYGWWPFGIGIILWLIIEREIDKKLDKVKEKEILLKYPYLKSLKSGQVISLKLKNGKEFNHMTYYYFIGDELTVTDAPYGEIINDLKSIRYIKLKKITSLKVVEG